MNWINHPNFKREEFLCQHCGSEGIKPEFLDKLQALRTAYGKPMKITSGYRCNKHPIEAKKPSPGAHSSGLAADIAVSGADAHRLLSLALAHGFTGIGIQQKGDARFIHLDTLTGATRPALWSY
jgi:zinc D-Ala-D-Ala carboxypeptidase